MVIGLRRAKGSLEVRALVRSPSTLRTDIVSFSFFFFWGGGHVLGPAVQGCGCPDEAALQPNASF